MARLPATVLAGVHAVAAQLRTLVDGAPIGMPHDVRLVGSHLAPCGCMLKIIVSAGVSAAALFVLTGCPDREVVRVDRPVVVERRTEVVRPVVRQPEVIVEERR